MTFIIFLSTGLAARLAMLAWKRHRRASFDNKSLTGATQSNGPACLRHSAAATLAGTKDLKRWRKIPDIRTLVRPER